MLLLAPCRPTIVNDLNQVAHRHRPSEAERPSGPSEASREMGKNGPYWPFTSPPQHRFRSPPSAPTSNHTSPIGPRGSKMIVYGCCLAILCLIGVFPVMANELSCPESCKCSRPSAYHPQADWKSTIDSPSVNCSNQSLDDFADVILSLYDPIQNIESHNSSGNTQVHHLHVLDLKYNSFKDVQFIDAMVAEGNVSWLGIDAIDIGHNSIASIVVDDTCLLDKVLSLDLSFNMLENFNDVMWRLCPGFQYLQHLNVSHNSIKELGNVSFSSLVQLTSFDLSFNQLDTIHSSSFEGMTSLQYLSLHGNNLISVTDVFPLLPNLRFLDLSSNFLGNLPNQVFSDLSMLRTLKLAKNNITCLEANVFDGLTNLVELSLNQNPLISLDQPVFQNTAMQRLSISSMPHLKNVSHYVFSGLSNLTYLNMSHNQQLQFLQPSILSPLSSLQILDLSYSGLQHLSIITFLNPSLSTVYLEGLPLACVCTNAWIAEESVKNGSIFVGIASNSCMDAKNQSQDSGSADFNCGAVYITNATEELSIYLGSKLMLQCQQDSSEQAVLVWTTPSGQKFYHHDFHPDALLHLLSPEEVQPGAPFHEGHYWHHSSSYHSEISSDPDRILILTDGSLYIDYMLRQDAGDYTCEVKNPISNHSTTVTLYVENDISGRIKIYALVVGFLCALAFFTLNVVYVIITWTARRLVNKRRRETILQMLENLNSYKSVQITRIHENYINQLHKVRNQYHLQRDKLHKNYTSQVTKVKRGCSHQVERVRENYTSRLAQLREYSSRQILQIRESTNNQITRIRDYGSLQLERLRETYKLQQQHVLKLLDTMNLENCRTVVETECMRTESMMFDIDLLDDRIDSPMSPDSEYSTAASSPNSSDQFSEDNEVYDRMQPDVYNDIENRSDDNEGQNNEIEIEMNTHLSVMGGIEVDAKEVWKYTGDEDNEEDHTLYTSVRGPGLGRYGAPHKDWQRKAQACTSQSAMDSSSTDPLPEHAALPLQTVSLDNLSLSKQPAGDARESKSQDNANNEETWSGNFVTPEASPIKFWLHNEAPDEMNTTLDDVEVKIDDMKAQEESKL